MTTPENREQFRSPSPPRPAPREPERNPEGDWVEETRRQVADARAARRAHWRRAEQDGRP